MRPPSCSKPAKLLALVLLSAIVTARQDDAAAGEESRQLQLEVFINDAATEFVAAFTRLPDGRFAATRAELAELGIKPPGSGNPDDLIVVEDMPDTSYRYDEPEQKIYFSLGDERRITRIYDARGFYERVAAVRNEYGAVVNYTLFGASGASQFGLNGLSFSGANASLDTRVFSPYGTLSQTGIIGTTTAKQFDTIRLDTTWSYSDPENVLTYRAGDTVSGGLAWTRPVRLGGFQVQRNFGLRPDLVMMPMPSFSGSAAVPSTVDIYLNSLKTYSQEVGSGPYQLNNLPLAGGGTARIVVQDASGRAVETSLPFYSSPRMLREGMTDFSVEAGVPRLLYGTQSFSYLRDPVGTASLRRGMFDWLTLEGHAEGGAGLINGGIGSVVSVGPWGALSLAGSGSLYDKTWGLQSYAAFDTRIGPINIHASSQRTFRSYNDLGSVTARALPLVSRLSDPANELPNMDLLSASYFPPKFLDTVSVSFPVPFDRGSIGAAFLHIQMMDGKRSDILNLSYARPLPWDASLHVSAFADFKDKKTGGIFAGISVPLGKSVTAAAGVAQTRKGQMFTAEMGKALQPETGSYGWRLYDNEAGQGTPASLANRTAMGVYRSSVAQLEGNAWQRNGSAGASLQADGAVAVMGGGVFLSNRIADSFAVVDTGAPNVEVLYENRPAGKTNAQGKVLIPTLRSYQPNRIAIDAAGLPVDADVTETQHIVTPADRTGIVVRFGVKTDVKAALVVLSDKEGKFLPVGATGWLEGSDESFMVGYDGRAYVKGLGEANTVIVTSAAGECRASFPYAAQKGSQVLVGPVACQ